jgi:hypothetical protein
VRIFETDMKKLTKVADPASEEMGRWVGRRDAFAAIAGRCSAAEAESLRRVRDSKMYRSLGLTWEEFCRTRLGTSRQHIDRTLRLLDEFGPQYFHVAQLAHVTADEYRAIAPHVGTEGVRVDGAVIALIPENSEQVSAAVAELIRRGKPEAAPCPPSTEAVLKRLESAQEALWTLTLDDVQKNRLCYVVTWLMNAAEAHGIAMPEW